MKKNRKTKRKQIQKNNKRDSEDFQTNLYELKEQLLNFSGIDKFEACSHFSWSPSQGQKEIVNKEGDVEKC